jgi:hypothetical protein
VEEKAAITAILTELREAYPSLMTPLPKTFNQNADLQEVRSESDAPITVEMRLSLGHIYTDELEPALYQPIQFRHIGGNTSIGKQPIAGDLAANPDLVDIFDYLAFGQWFPAPNAGQMSGLTGDPLDFRQFMSYQENYTDVSVQASYDEYVAALDPGLSDSERESALLNAPMLETETPSYLQTSHKPKKGEIATLSTWEAEILNIIDAAQEYTKTRCKNVI